MRLREEKGGKERRLEGEAEIVRKQPLSSISSFPPNRYFRSSSSVRSDLCTCISLMYQLCPMPQIEAQILDPLALQLLEYSTRFTAFFSHVLLCTVLLYSDSLFNSLPFRYRASGVLEIRGLLENYVDFVLVFSRRPISALIYHSNSSSHAHRYS